MNTVAGKVGGVDAEQEEEVGQEQNQSWEEVGANNKALKNNIVPVDNITAEIIKYKEEKQQVCMRLLWKYGKS